MNTNNTNKRKNGRNRFRVCGIRSAVRAALCAVALWLAAVPFAVSQNTNLGSLRQAVNDAGVLPYNTVYFGIYPQTYINTALMLRGAMPAIAPTGPFKVVEQDFQQPNGGNMPTIQPKDQVTVYNVDPIRWQVLSDDAEGILLLSDRNLDFQPYDNIGSGWNGQWTSSTMRAWLSGSFLGGQSDNTIPPVYTSAGAGTNTEDVGTLAPSASTATTAVYTSSSPNPDAQAPYFSVAEKDAVVASALTNPTMGKDVDNQDTQDQVFLPSLADIEAAFPTVDNTRNSENTSYVNSYPNTSTGADDWFTRTHSRSPFAHYETAISYTTHADINVAAADKKAVRPALRLDRSKVLMVSGGKAGVSATLAAAGSFSPTPAAPLKLTLVDDYLGFIVTDVEATAAAISAAPSNMPTDYHPVELNGTLDISYEDVTATADDYISCILVNAAGEILYYTKLESAATAAPDGTRTVDFTGVPEEAYVLKVFYEQTNAGGKPDYVSTPFDIKVYVMGVTPAVSPAIDPAFSFPNSFVGKTYDKTLLLSTTGFPAPVFSIASGALPDGLTLDPVTGRLYGVLTTDDDYEFTLRVENAAGEAVEKTYTIEVATIVAPEFDPAALTLELATDSFIGYLSIPYSYHVKMKPNTGLPTTTFTLSGSIPGGSGMTLTPDGHIYGTPTQDETQTFTVRAETEGEYAYQEYTISILQSPPTAYGPTFITTSLLTPSVKEGQAYTPQVIQVYGSEPMDVGYAPATFPAGMEFDPISREIKGTPIAGQAGTYTLELIATNPLASPANVSQTYELTVIPPNLPSLLTASLLPQGMQNVPYTVTFTSDDPTATWSFGGAGFLPPGCTSGDLSSGGNLSFTPTTPGTYSFNVKASNLEGASDLTYTLEIATPLPAPLISASSLASLPSGTVGQSYPGATLSASNSPSAWTVSSGSLPPGVALSNSGVITGSPTTPGTYTFSVTASNPTGPSAAVAGTIVIQPSPTSVPPTLVTYLSSGGRGVAYSERVSTFTRPDIVWSVASGTLPPGLELSADGVIHGIPTSQGEYEFTVKAASNLIPSGFEEVTKTLTIRVALDMVISIQRSVNLPHIPGAQTSPEAGAHSVASGKDFVFVITPDASTETLSPVVTTGRTRIPDEEGVVVTENADGTYTVQILAVQEAVEISVLLIDNTSGVAAVEGTFAWSEGNRLYIRSSQSGDAKVYDITGRLVKSQPTVAGETCITTFPKGLYLVTLNGKVFKIIVK